VGFEDVGFGREVANGCKAQALISGAIGGSVAALEDVTVVEEGFADGLGVDVSNWEAWKESGRNDYPRN